MNEYRDPRSGITVGLGHPFGVALAKGLREDARAEAAWTQELISAGVKAAHPDDGWVKRDRNSVSFCYPQFNLRPQPGDVIALGHHDKYRLVRVTRVVPWLLRMDENCVDYYFEEVCDDELSGDVSAQEIALDLEMLGDER